MSTDFEPLRIGILGAARVAPDAIVGPAHELGHRLVAVAARDRRRAKQFAEVHRVERVVDDYAALIADPEIDVVYNPLANSLHAPWNLAAVRAGKAVLTEKPFARNEIEAREVGEAATAAGVPIVEGFHYLFHPGFARTTELLDDGVIGDLRRIEVTMSMPIPPPHDPRWSYALAGGAMMDVGCYAAHLFRTVAGRRDELVTVTGARCVVRDQQIDERTDFGVVFSGGTVGSASTSMVGDRYVFTARYIGDRGELAVADFLGPSRDDRLTLTRTDGTRIVEHVSRRSTYSYQLEAFAAAVRRGTPLPIGVDDAVENMAMIDTVYRQAGLSSR